MNENLVITHNSPQRRRDAEKTAFYLCASARLRQSAVGFGLVGNHQTKMHATVSI